MRKYWISSLWHRKSGPPAQDFGKLLTNLHQKILVLLRNGYMCLGHGLTVVFKERTSCYMMCQKVHVAVDSPFYAPLDAGVYKSTALILANIITRGCRGAPPCLCVTKRLQQQMRPNCHSMHRLRHSAASLYVRSLKLINPLRTVVTTCTTYSDVKKFSISTIHCECMYYIRFTPWT